MPISDKLRKVAGLFVVMDETASEPAKDDAPINFSQPAATGDVSGNDLDRRLAEMNANLEQLKTGGAQTVEQIVQKAPGPNLDQISVSASDVPPPLPNGDGVNFTAIYDSASLPAAPFSAEQTLEMLAKLPANLPLEMKRQTVQVTLSAMGSAIGATVESIVADASRKLAALASYTTDLGRTTEQYIAAADAEIAALTQQIEEKKTKILQAKERQAAIQLACDTEADRLDDILEFFSLDVGTSKYADTSTTLTPR